MSLQTFNDYVARIAAGYRQSQPIWGEVLTNVGTEAGGTPASLRTPIVAKTRAMRASFPTGVTGFIITDFSVVASNGGPSLMLAKYISFGTLNISSNAFTDGSQMPTVTELGVSRQISSPLFVKTNTALSATPGSFTVTYVDQDGNTAEATASTGLAGSVGLGVGNLIRLNAPDNGVVDVTTASRTGGTTPTGTLEFFGLIPLGWAMPINSLAPAVCNNLTDQIRPYRLGQGDEVVVMLIGCGNSYTGGFTGVVNIVGDN